ncbi:phosphotransferase family protein [Actinoplanes teichomyceticus]|uniref:Aminoglycoside phosphotransferase (APT) family kinase protein n=1 Tax=Actinoplanes teichomyceticus TaxID=1867 RepID=A0A561VM56_ACTTI|nr:phosphotransferase family protein [Actinoplanes teichomyceticus]TWG12672.1 aminoglycoside phosphotransferase (APT) family kinase protein [Actinoplanes teichomyceticus]GIF13405.1 aminoglycoside phosphotransferase [Actinoplanes teichomyceticus]
MSLRPVRAEDAFDAAAVAGWLGVDGTPQVRQFAGGASNLTYLLRWPERDLILRRPPAGRKAAGAHDMGREYRIQAALAPVFRHVPEMVAYCADESVIGSPFYLMRRVAGHIPRRELGLDLPPGQVRQLCTRALDLLADLHAVDPAAAGLSDLGRGAGYVSRQVDGWSGRYRAARTRNVGSFEKVMAWLRDNQPADRGACLIHNDFRFDNLVFDPADPTRPVALLDWEMATVGDPLMDLGGALAYWVQADDGPLMRAFRRQPTHTPGMLTRREVVDYYCARSGIGLTDRQWAFYEVFGLFRLAVIVQQIYYRYHHRQTRNPAFRHFWVASLMLEARCRRIIGRVARGREPG